MKIISNQIIILISGIRNFHFFNTCDHSLESYDDAEGDVIRESIKIKKVTRSAAHFKARTFPC